MKKKLLLFSIPVLLMVLVIFILANYPEKPTEANYMTDVPKVVGNKVTLHGTGLTNKNYTEYNENRKITFKKMKERETEELHIVKCVEGKKNMKVTVRLKGAHNTPRPKE